MIGKIYSIFLVAIVIVIFIIYPHWGKIPLKISDFSIYNSAEELKQGKLSSLTNDIRYVSPPIFNEGVASKGLEIFMVPKLAVVCNSVTFVGENTEQMPFIANVYAYKDADINSEKIKLASIQGTRGVNKTYRFNNNKAYPLYVIEILKINAALDVKSITNTLILTKLRLNGYIPIPKK